MRRWAVVALACGLAWGGSATAQTLGDVGAAMATQGALQGGAVSNGAAAKAAATRAAASAGNHGGGLDAWTGGGEPGSKGGAGTKDGWAVAAKSRGDAARTKGWARPSRGGKGGASGTGWATASAGSHSGWARRDLTKRSGKPSPHPTTP